MKRINKFSKGFFWFGAIIFPTYFLIIHSIVEISKFNKGFINSIYMIANIIVSLGIAVAWIFTAKQVYNKAKINPGKQNSNSLHIGKNKNNQCN